MGEEIIIHIDYFSMTLKSDLLLAKVSVIVLTVIPCHQRYIKQNRQLLCKTLADTLNHDHKLFDHEGVSKVNSLCQISPFFLYYL